MWNDLPLDVRAELEDPAFIGRTHHKKATYAKGCRGLLCRKSERDEARDITREAAEKMGREYVPRPTPAQERDDLLDVIKLWHWEVRGQAHAVKACACE